MRARRIDNTATALVAYAKSIGFDYEVGQKIKDMCEEYRTSMIVTHHARKGGGYDDDWLDMVSGSAGMAAATDAIWYITRTRGTRNGLLRATGNDLDEFEQPVELNSEQYIVQR